VNAAALPPPAAAAFSLLVIAIAASWAPRVSRAPSARHLWASWFAAAVLMGLAAGVIDLRGVGWLVLFGAVCHAAGHGASWRLRAAAHVPLMALATGLLVHALPGFDNPRVLDEVRLSADSVPYTRYVNFDKGAMAVLLLALYVGRGVPRDDAPGPLRASIAAWLIATLAVTAFSLALGYVRWDPKLPDWWPMWLLAMIWLTALPEEALFRGVVQARLRDLAGDSAAGRALAVAGAAAVFGLAHAGGGWTYVLLAAIAGLGYGAIYAMTGSVWASAAGHTALNLVHLLFFSYPALAVSGVGP
jgi:membrane protease YdiL (CAAX protease family)